MLLLFSALTLASEGIDTVGQRLRLLAAHVFASAVVLGIAYASRVLLLVAPWLKYEDRLRDTFLLLSIAFFVWSVAMAEWTFRRPRGRVLALVLGYFAGLAVHLSGAGTGSLRASAERLGVLGLISIFLNPVCLGAALMGLVGVVLVELALGPRHLRNK